MPDGRLADTGDVGRAMVAEFLALAEQGHLEVESVEGEFVLRLIGPRR